MRNRVKSGESCWNSEAIEAYVGKINTFEEGHITASPENLLLNEGQVGCHGCQDGRCTAELAKTTIQPLGQGTSPMGEHLGASIEDIEGFEVNEPEGWGEAEVVDIRRDKAA